VIAVVTLFRTIIDKDLFYLLKEVVDVSEK